MIRAVAFDLGGVLVDVSLQRLYDAVGMPARAVEDAFFAGGNHDELSTGRRTPTAFVETAALRLGISTGLAARAWRRIVALPGAVPDLVRDLAVPCFAWSNTDPLHVEALRALLPPQLFSPRRCLSFEVGVDKPEPRFFETGLSRAGVGATELLYLDDRPENVAVARDMGVIAQCVRGIDETRAVLEAHHLLLPREPGPRVQTSY